MFNTITFNVLKLFPSIKYSCDMKYIDKYKKLKPKCKT